MSLLGKLFHSLTGSANDALDAHQNLGANARQSVRELDAQLQEADSALINVRAEAEILKGKKENAEAGKDDSLAKECLVKKSSASSALDVIIYSINKFQPTVTALETRIDQLRSQRDGLSNQADLIGVRSEVADVEMKAATILGATGVSTSLASQEDALTRKEARAHAATSLVADRSGESLEARVAALTTGPSIDDELAALKAGK